ncbi:MAG: hypothetical protein AAFP68_20640, partial [Pseudomonadota bacterium]
ATRMDQSFYQLAGRKELRPPICIIIAHHDTSIAEHSAKACRIGSFLAFFLGARRMRVKVGIPFNTDGRSRAAVRRWE